MNLAPTKGKSEKLGSLEIGRGLAAIAVVLHHAAISSAAFTSGNSGGSFDWGIYGVDFFFVLSGFIIFHVHKDDARTLQSALGFLAKRVRRVYIPYLPISIGLIGLYTMLPELSSGDRVWGWLPSQTLIRTAYPPALSVAWTLSYEIVFYLIFCCILLLGCSL